jgi:hypothetical protein
MIEDEPHNSPQSAPAGASAPAGQRSGEGTASLSPYLGNSQCRPSPVGNPAVGEQATELLIAWHARTRELEATLNRPHRDDFSAWLTEIHQLSAQCDDLWTKYDRARDS